MSLYDFKEWVQQFDWIQDQEVDSVNFGRLKISSMVELALAFDKSYLALYLCILNREEPEYSSANIQVCMQGAMPYLKASDTYFTSFNQDNNTVFPYSSGLYLNQLIALKNLNAQDWQKKIVNFCEFWAYFREKIKK
jgi:hypothetical protein